MDYSPSESRSPSWGGLFHPGEAAEASNDSRASAPKPDGKDPIPMVSFFDGTKAGLQKVDKDKTELAIRQLSSGSLFYKNEERKSHARAQRVEAMLEKKTLYEATIASDPGRLRGVCHEVATIEQDLERERFFDRVFAHIDMDMFYAAVEEKKNPELRDVPFGVGSLQMLSTTNYIARQYGVRSGMPGFIGVKLCPDLRIVQTDFASYQGEAAVVKAIVCEYDPDLCSFGLDEQRLDLTDHLALNFPDAQSLESRYAAAEEVVAGCRERIFEATRLTASAGIGPTPTLAKMASNFNKPNGQHTLRLDSREAVMAFMRPFSCRQVPGIGKSFEAILQGLGIATVGDIYDQRHWLSFIFTPKTFSFLLSMALGVGGFMGTSHGDLNADKDALGNLKVDCKSIGNECTFQHLKHPREMEEIAYDILRNVVRRLKKKALVCGRVVLKLKHIEFQVRQYSKSLPKGSDDEAVLRHALDELLAPFLESFMNYRLLGVRAEKLIPEKESEERSEGKGQATLDRFFNMGRVKRDREEPSKDKDDSVEPEATLPRRTPRGDSSDAQARDTGGHLGHGKSPTMLLATPNVILIDSQPCTPPTKREESPPLTISSSPAVLSFHELSTISPPLEVHPTILTPNGLSDKENEVSNADSNDVVFIIE
ncbi:unnamed protein product [Phytomonas sp. Hart1]|nr:unnamed protein product [Phytomonas sp. Hart1]|eukprot:CCW68678.1 unnamed protein product [Phytomonas sp. isolate Hart1]